MTWQTLKARRIGVLATTLSVAALAIGVASHLAAQDAGAPAASPDAGGADEPKSATRSRKHRVVRKAPAKPAETQNEAAAAPLPAVTAPAKAAESIDFAAQLDKAGASACHGQVNALASSTMGSVVAYNTVSNWSASAGDKHAVSVAIGQKYADGSVVPFSVTQVIAAPNQQGSCDGFTLQVLPSPLSCDKLRASLSTSAKQIGDLAGVSLMQDASGRTLLMPTAAKTCVLVAMHTMYAQQR